jgi:hypothetical protein
MLLNIINTLWHLPMVWDFIIPIAILFIFCAVLFWKGEYGKAVKKRFALKRKEIS